MNMFRVLLLVMLSVFIASCSSTGGQSGRYSMKNDKAPDREVDVSHVKDAVPRVESKSRGGNKSPYTVLGKSYRVMDSSAGYVATGSASWYGRKFHGHKTSNGEVYDMYEMSAAHKSLPLPTFLKVTNLANNRQVIVRVNDRGPFHGDRLIDLSYAAASKLDMLKKGTARVRLEAIDPRTWNGGQKTIPVAMPQPINDIQGKYLQVGAYSSQDSADYVKSHLRPVLQDIPVIVRSLLREGRTLYRVHVGPLTANSSLAELTKRVELMGYSNPRLVDFP